MIAIATESRCSVFNKCVVLIPYLLIIENKLEINIITWFNFLCWHLEEVLFYLVNQVIIIFSTHYSKYVIINELIFCFSPPGGLFQSARVPPFSFLLPKRF